MSEKQRNLVIAIDFDASCVTFDYPKIGKDIGAVPVLKKLVESGHKIMLWTMRGNKPGNTTLDDAINWFKENEIELWGINENPDQKVTGWTNSNKQHANIYIDDAALGCPLIYNKNFHSRPYVDWVRVDKMLEEMGVY